MQNINSSVWFKGFMIAALVSCGSFVVAAETETKKENAAAVVSTAPAPAPPQGVIARVNGIDINAVELRRAEKIMLRGQTVPADQQAAVDKQAVKQLISAELLYQGAAKQEYKDLEKDIDEKLVKGKSRFKTEEEFQKAIKDLEMNEKELREYTRRDLLITRFIEKTFVPKVTVSESDVRAFYDKNPDKFSQAESVKASHILIGVESAATPEAKKKAREKAESLRKELAGGADFATLAKGNSTCPSSKQGGDLGSFGKGQMVPPFENAVFALKPGEMSDVVETQFGYHIIKLTEKKPAVVTDYKEVKPKIEEFLKGQGVNESIQKYIADSEKAAKIEILLK